MGNKADAGLDDEPLELGAPGGAAAGKDGDDKDVGADADGAVGADAGAGGDDLEIVIAEDDPGTGAGADGGADTTGAAPAASDGGDAGGGDDDLEPGDKGYSKNVQERIRREVAVRKRAVEAAESRVREEATARQAAEHRMLGLELSTAKMADQTLKGQIKEAKAELIAAQEAGETVKAVDAQQKLNELQIRLREVETLQTDLEARVEKAKAAPAAGTVARVRPITQAWVDRNKWFTNPKYSVAAAAVKAISTELDRGGISPDDPKHYTEIDRRLHMEIPNLRQRVKADAPRPDTNRPGAGTIVAPARQAPAKGTSPNRITLNKADLQNMRSFGMDPTNKVHLREYALSKQGVASNG